jgi:hypothetical protein
MTTHKNPDGNYADVNGINLYYETFGAGEPLIINDEKQNCRHIMAAILLALRCLQSLFLSPHSRSSRSFCTSKKTAAAINAATRIHCQ